MTDADRRDARAVLVDGDERAFRALYARHTPALYAFAHRLLGADGDEADDVIQEAWLRATRRLGDFTWGSALRTWLMSVVLNCCRERWRARGELLVVPDESLAGTTTDVHARLDLEHALASLPTGYRTVIVLHDIEGYTHEEIAEHLGVEPGTSKSQLARARRALRRQLHER